MKLQNEETGGDMKEKKKEKKKKELKVQNEGEAEKEAVDRKVRIGT